MAGWSQSNTDNRERLINTQEEAMMRQRVNFLVAAVMFLFSVSVWAAEFKPYPGAKLDEKATKDAQEVAAMMKTKTKAKASVYTTDDSFEKVYEFYKGVAKEFSMPHFSAEGTKSAITGQTMKAAFFIMDGAPDIQTSNLWIKVQRPAIGLYKEDLEKAQDITAIIVSEKR